MSLKQSIVVKNEFTHNGVNTPGKGTRGGSPGQYVLRYMARIDATETITPVPDSQDDSIFAYTTRYMMREDATEKLKSSGQYLPSSYELQSTFRQQDKLSGRSFGSRGISLSDDTVRDSSQIIQDAFDEGHSVQKIILSFTEEYLKENKVLPENYQHNGRGSYKGQIDQLKLRQAVTNGVNKMTSVGNYANPEWVGVIQVDTNHVHAHLALVDTEFSPSRMMDDGRDKGKLTQREMMTLRRGIQYELNDMKAIKGFHKQVSLERQNVVGYIKDYAHDYIEKNSRLQILLAALPEEQHLWRHGSNRQEMQYPNELAQQFVEMVFEEQPVRSGYRNATRSIEQYIKGRVDTEGIDPNEQERLRRNGRNLLIERSVNGVYDALKPFDKTKLTLSTPMLDIQSSSEDELMGQLSDGFDQAGFELRVRGYSNRRDHHTDESIQYKQLIDVFDDANAQNDVSSDAFVLRRFYEEELQWNMALADKYRSFFRMNGRRDRQMKEKHMPMYEQLESRYARLDNQDAFLQAVDDGSIFEGLDGVESVDDVFLQADSVNDQIEEQFGVKQGSRAFSALYREGLVQEIQLAKDAYMKDLRDYTFDCFVDGVATQADWVRLQTEHREVDSFEYERNLSYGTVQLLEPNEPQVREDGITDEHFDQIKALDIHHLGIDFYTKSDRSIAEKNRNRFADAMQWREYLLDGAETFLDATGQHVQLQALKAVSNDVKDMRKTVDYMADNGMIPTIDPIASSAREKRNTYTIRVDTGVDVLQSMGQQLSFTDDDLEVELSLFNDDVTIVEIEDLMDDPPVDEFSGLG